jgi:two-component system OmpR family sensor kinase
MPMSIRLRLTLLYSAILALTLTVLSVALYVTQARYTLGSHKRDLELQARRITLWVARAVVLPERRGMRREGPFPPQPAPLGEQDLRELRSRDTVRILDREGTVLDLPINQEGDGLPLSDKSLQVVLSGKPWTEIAAVEGERLLIFSLPVHLEDDIAGIVQVARSLADRDRSLRALGVALLAGTLVTTIAAFGIGWVLSGVTLRPIDRITQTAQAIGAARDLSQRIAYAGPNDEIGQLAATLNAMLSELEDAYQQVEQALEMQRTFVADVSHELRTPLTTLRGNLALLRRQPPIQEEERQDVLDDMVGESESLILLANDLLALARAEAGRQVLSERVLIAPLVEEICRQARVLAPDREILCAPLPDVAVLADPSALKQVLLVLLDNAILHTEGAVTVTTRLSPGVDECHLAIDICDSGPGIDPETLSSLFVRFTRGRDARSKPGTGLGLPIAKALAEAQSGTLTVESRVGQGSRFTLTLPLYGDRVRPR